MKVPGPPSAADPAQSFDGLSRYLGARVTLREDRSTEIVIPAADYALDPEGRHGDLAITCAIDIATGMASSMAGDSPGATLTSDMSIDLVAEPSPGELRTVGRVIKMGRRVIMNEAVVTDSTGSVVAFATAGCAPMAEISWDLHSDGFRPGTTVDLSSSEHTHRPIATLYDMTPTVDVPADAPAPVASIELNRLTANPFGFLHGAVGASLLLAGARRSGLQQVSSITVRYLRPTTHGPADVIVDNTFGGGRGLKLSLRDRATGKVACAAHVRGAPG